MSSIGGSNARAKSPKDAKRWATAGWIVAAATVLFIRKSDAFMNPQFWAEDAAQFFVPANIFGKSVLTWRYAGYMHLLPRLIAWPSAALDPRFQPAAYLAASFCVTLAIVALALSPRLDLPCRPLLALAIVAVPHTGEVFLNPTNLQWITALGLLLTLLNRDPVSALDWLIDLLILTFVGLTGPFSVLFAPLFLARSLQRRTVASWILLAAMVPSALVQGWFIGHGGMQPGPNTWHLARLGGVLSFRLAMTLACGAPWAAKLGDAWSTAISAMLAVAAAVLVCRRDRFRDARLFLSAAFALVLISAIIRIRPDAWASSHVESGDRYFYVPKVILVWLAVLVAAGFPFGWQRRIGYAFLALGFAANLREFEFAPLPDLHWASYCGKIRAGERVEIPINPGWTITYPGWSQPSSQTVASGGTAVFTFAAKGKGSATPAYQWSFNRSPLWGATDKMLVINRATMANSGSYACTVTNSAGSVTSAAATLTVVNATDPGRLINLAVRLSVGTANNVLIGGFVIGGAGTAGRKPVLIRASGPALEAIGVSEALSDPQLQLDNGGGKIADNTRWGADAQTIATAAAVGAFAWADPSSHDSALLRTLPPGGYTAVVSGASGDTGVALLEVYDATPSGSFAATTPRLINLAARGKVGTESNTMIAGFVIGGSTAKTVLVRASGPALATLGIPEALPDPQLQLMSGNTILATHAGWDGNLQISSVANSVGAFSWGGIPSNDSALLVTLPPGAYTAHVSSASGDTGVALLEIYEVP